MKRGIVSQKTTATLTHLALLVGWVTFSVSAALGQEWSQWRGAARDGVTAGQAWPSTLDAESLTQAWRVEGLGASYSGPVIRDGIVYTTANVDSTVESVVALDEGTGEQRWIRSWPVRFVMPKSMAMHGNWPKSTPTVDGPDLFFLSIDEQLVRLDAKTGKLRWRLDFPSQFKTPIPEFGASSSPLVSGDSVYVQAAGSLVAIDRQTGEIRWRSFRLYETETGADDLEAYGSPILGTLHGVEQVIVHTVKGLAGVDARSGDVLWLVAAEPGEPDSPNVTPALVDHGQGQWVLTTTEASGSPLFRIDRTDQGFSAREVWRSKVHGNMASPVVAGGYAYLPLKNGRLALLDLQGNKEVWISKPLFGAYSSAARRDDKILLLSGDGELFLVTTDTGGMRVLDSRQVAGRTWAHLAVQGDRIYVRSETSLVALEWTAPGRRQSIAAGKSASSPVRGLAGNRP